MLWELIEKSDMVDKSNKKKKTLGIFKFLRNGSLMVILEYVKPLAWEQKNELQA